MYYGGSSDHHAANRIRRHVLGIHPRPPAHAPCEPLASAEMAAIVDAGGDALRRRGPMVRAGPDRGSLWRTATVPRAPGGGPGGGSGHRAVPATEAGFPPEASVRARTALLGG